MDLSPETISTVLLLIIIAFVLLFFSLNIYLILKNGFYVPVNCWFCNKNSKVLYSLKNSFECNHCLQYNGFKKNGDYNKIIQAQFDPSKNLQPMANFYKNVQYSSPNALCATCTHHLQLKVFQLANFVSLDEKNYDVEVEHFEKQLDKAYKLCPPCEKLLNCTLRKQNAWIFGRHLKDLQKYKKSQGILTKQSIILKCVRLVLILLAFVLLFKITYNIDLKATHKYKIYMPSLFIIYLRQIQDFCMVVQNALFKFLESYNTRHYFKMLPIATTYFGVSLELILITFDVYSKWLKTNEIICWTILTLSLNVMVPISLQLMPYVNVLQLFCLTYLILNYAHHMLKKQTAATKLPSKRMKPTEATDDFFDTEEIAENKSNVKPTKQNIRYKSRTSTAKNGLNGTFNYVRTPNKTVSVFNSSSDAFYSDSEEDFYDGTARKNSSSEGSRLTSSFSELKLGRKNRKVFSPNNTQMYSSLFKPRDHSFVSPRRPMSPLFTKQHISPNNSFLLPQQQTSPNNLFIPSAIPFQQNCPIFVETQAPVSPRSSLNNFDNSQYIFGAHSPNNNTFVSTQPRLVRSPQCMSSHTNYANFQDTMSQKSGLTSPLNMFRPVSPSNSVLSHRPSILSPPKFNNVSNSFGFQNQPTFVYQSVLFNDTTLSQKGPIKNLNSEFPKSNLFNLNNSFSPTRTSSRASSESSGFASTTELFKTASQSTSRNPSPERNVGISNPINHFKTY